MPYDFLIVGAGFSGSVLAERIASQLDKRVLLIDRRGHVCGNAFDEADSSGIRVHRYGPHLFHTNEAHIISYLSRFTEWHPYEHKVRSYINGALVPMPINRTTINELFDLTLATDEDVADFLHNEREQIPHVLTSEQFVLSRAGRRLYDILYRGYSTKHWGVDPSLLSPQVCGRLPIRYNCDDRYFDDKFQLMPRDGYSNLFRNMLEHPKIDVSTGTDFKELQGITWKHLIYTGPIDEYFGYVHGRLPYRSLYFNYETFEKEFVQPVAQINYPNDFEYTRTIEFKHITGQSSRFTTVATEFPSDIGDPFYPIPSQESRALYNKYKELSEKLSTVTFAGRLGTYKYLNMDQVVGQSLSLFHKLFQ